MKSIYILLIIFLSTTSILAKTATRWDIVPYVGYTDYNKTLTKQNSTILGAYSYYGHGAHHSLETDLSYSHIKYDSPTLSRINQTSFTLAYTNYQLLDIKWRLGGQAIFSTDDVTQGNMIFAGIHYYQPQQYSIGIDTYYSRYADFIPDLDVLQVTGTYTVQFSPTQQQGRWYSATKAHVIQLSEDIGYGDRTYTSLEQSLNYSIPYWNFALFGWFGNQVFGVQKDGFVIYNLAEKHRGSFGGSIKWAYTEKSALKFEIAYTQFNELTNPETANSLRLMLMAPHTF